MPQDTVPAPSAGVQSIKDVSLDAFMKHACAVLESNGHPILTPSAYRPWHSTLARLQDSKAPELEIPDSVRMLTWRGSDSYNKSKEVVRAFEYLVRDWTIFAPHGLEYKFSKNWPKLGDDCLKDALEELGRMPAGYQRAVEELARGVACRIENVQGLGMGMFAQVTWTPVPLRKTDPPLPVSAIPKRRSDELF